MRGVKELYNVISINQQQNVQGRKDKACFFLGVFLFQSKHRNKKRMAVYTVRQCRRSNDKNKHNYTM